MKNIYKILIIYTPIILIAGQLAANIIYFVDSDFYSDWYFLIGSLFGGNLLMAGLLVALSFHFKFCKVSRVCALAQLLFCLFYLVFPDNYLYNLIIQLSVGGVALGITITMAFTKWQTIQFGR